MEPPTLFPWRPVLVHRRTPNVVFRPVYEADWEPVMRCIGPSGAVTLCADVACLAWGGWMEEPHDAFWPEWRRDRLLKPGLQKRLKKRTDCGGNHLGCPAGAEEGLQCGLSGSRAARLATSRRGAERETASIGNERCAAGKTSPYLSRKIYLVCRRKHPYPSRTRRLRPKRPMVLHWRRCGRAGGCRIMGT